MFSIIKPRGDIKANWESVNPVLRLREWGVEWEEFVGTGDVKVKIGDGVKHWNELDYAIINDVTKKIVKTFAEVNSDDNPNPILNPGESIDALFGKIKQKFEYATNFMTSLKNMVGDYQARSFNTGSGTVTADDLKSAIDILEQYKLTTANILDVNDSTNTFAALSANQGRLINEKAVANANAISTLNSNLGSKFPSDSEVRTRSELPNVTLIYWNNQGIHEGHFRLNISYDTFIDLTMTERSLWFSKTEGGVFLENKLVASFDN